MVKTEQLQRNVNTDSVFKNRSLWVITYCDNGIVQNANVTGLGSLCRV